MKIVGAVAEIQIIYILEFVIEIRITETLQLAQNHDAHRFVVQ